MARPGFIRRFAARVKQMLSPPQQNSGAWATIYDTTTGAWQRHEQPATEALLSYHAVYACITLIASDISKLKFRLVEKQNTGIWKEVERAAFSPVLRKPNGYQTQIQFRESWIISKLARGNTYALKERDRRGIVERLHILDPGLVQPLIADDGSVFYQLRRDTLTVGSEDVIVPAREIIHDRMNCLYHPLVGVSPLYACALAAGQGIAIQKDATQFAKNSLRAPGVLSAPGNIPKEVAEEISRQWRENFSGENAKNVAVLGNDLKFGMLAISPHDAQLIEQLKLTAEIICSVFHVPLHMIDLGPPPPHNNEDKYLGYFARTLQVLIENMEACLDEGLGLDGRTMGVKLDTEALLRMDTERRYKAHTEAIRGGWKSPDEARLSENLEPVPGGDTPYMQQQNYSLAALAKRDSMDPLAGPGPNPGGTVAPARDETRALLALLERRAPETLHAS